jgi:hypothetical protein
MEPAEKLLFNWLVGTTGTRYVKSGVEIEHKHNTILKYAILFSEQIQIWK